MNPAINRKYVFDYMNGVVDEYGQVRKYIQSPPRKTVIKDRFLNGKFVTNMARFNGMYVPTLNNIHEKLHFDLIYNDEGNIVIIHVMNRHVCMFGSLDYFHKIVSAMTREFGSSLKVTDIHDYSWGRRKFKITLDSDKFKWDEPIEVETPVEDPIDVNPIEIAMKEIRAEYERLDVEVNRTSAIVDAAELEYRKAYRARAEFMDKFNKIFE